MKRLTQTLAFGAAATAIVAAVAFGQAKDKMDAAAPAVGAPAPAYSLPDQTGTTRTSAENKGKVTLLAFYPADFTGGCTQEAHALSGSYKDLKAMGVQVYGVSVQDPKSHQAFCTKEGIPYTLLADTQHTMSADYGVLIPGANVANRVTYIIGADGKVAYIDKDVNSHLNTCGDDWISWIKAHPAVSDNPSARLKITGQASFMSEADATANHAQPRLRSDLRTRTIHLSNSGPATIGKFAPAFTLPNAQTDQARSLSTILFSSNVTVIIFISTRCPYSNAYVGRMKALAAKYAPKGVAFVGIDSDQDEPKSEVASYTKTKGFPFPVLEDKGAKVADAYTARVTPEAYVLNSGGTLVYHGRIDNDMDTANVHTHDLANAISETLAGKSVAKAQTKAFGCSIKK